MIKKVKKTLAVLFFLSLAVAAAGQADKRDVRAGNRKFRKGEFKEAEIDYRKALVKDSMSVTARYDLASALYRQEDFEGAGKILSGIPEEASSAESFFNAGDVALKRKDYAAAVKSFREALLLDPDDLDAKENYVYAKKMLENQQNGGGDNQNQGQDQDKNQNQDQNQNQNQDQDQDRNQGDGDDRQNQDNQNNQERQSPQQEGISPQQAQQMLRAVQAKEDETRSKVEKEKAALLQSRQKEKNW